MEPPSFQNFMDDPKISKLIQKNEQTESHPQQQEPELTPEQKQQMLESIRNRQLMDDPFSQPQYNSIRVPNTPISGGGGMAESLLNDYEVPDRIREKYWWVFHKDNTLTFLDEERKKSKLLNFDIAKIDILNTVPYYDYNFELELDLGILRNVFETKLDRALGVKDATRKNERITLQSSFSEQRLIQESGGSPSTIKSGFFSRLLRRS